MNLNSHGNCAFVHEMEHALGATHEMTRPDRDQFVTVNDGESGRPDYLDTDLDGSIHFQFAVRDSAEVSPYDYGSVMHYDSDAFISAAAKAAGNHVILTKSGGQIPYRWDLSPGDIGWINHHYPTEVPFPLPVNPCASGTATLNPGQGLRGGTSLTSCDGRFRLVMQNDGNLVLDFNNVRPLWQSNSGMDGAFDLKMQNDGNLVLYSGKANHPVWATNTAAHPGAVLKVQNDGNLVLYQSSQSNNVLWTTYTWLSGVLPPPQPTPVPSDPTRPCGQILGGFGLVNNAAVDSCDGRFSLTMQRDGNLVLYQKATTTFAQRAMWATATERTLAYKAVLQPDGNLVVYGVMDHVEWASNTAGNPGAHLDIQNDGNLVLHSAAGAILWASNTCCR